MNEEEKNNVSPNQDTQENNLSTENREENIGQNLKEDIKTQEQAPVVEKTITSEQEPVLKNERPTSIPTISELVEAGAQFGHKNTLTAPSMRPYIFGVVNGIAILNLDHTIGQIEQAMKFLTNSVLKNKKILWVGTRKILQSYVQALSEKTDSYFVTSRWSPGLLTNFKTIKMSLNRKAKMESIIEKSKEKKTNFTKKEIRGMILECSKIEERYGGLKDLETTPDLMIVLNPSNEPVAIKEANVLNIPIIAITDSNTKIDGEKGLEGIKYPIVSNDDSIKAIEIICNALLNAILEGIEKRVIKTGKKDFKTMAAISAATTAESPVFKPSSNPKLKKAEDGSFTKNLDFIQTNKVTKNLNIVQSEAPAK